MLFLHNLSGKHIANLDNNQLYSPRGENIGHYESGYEFFIDMNGKYLGEIIEENRLAYNKSNSYKNINFGNHGNYGNVGNYGNPGNIGNIGNISGYEDVVITWIM